MSGDLLPVSMNHLCCTVCSHVLKNPVTIPCGHTFCKECILKRWERDERNKCPRSCPECNHMFSSPPQLIINTTLAEMLRNTRGFDDARKMQMKMKMQMQRQHQHQHQSGGESPQKRARADKASGSALCRKHNWPLDVYCCTDGRIICAMCAEAEHRGHSIGCVGEERRRKEEELRNIQTESKQILQKQKRKCRNLKNVLTQIEEEATQTADYCESVVVGVIACLQKHYLLVKEQIGAQAKAAADQVSTSVQTLEAKIKEMEERDAELDRLAQSDSDTHFLQEWPALQSLCDVDHLHFQSELSEDPLLPFKFTKRAVQELGTRLKEFCKEEFASVTETGVSGEEQNLTGETEEGVMQQGCDSSTSPSHGCSGNGFSLTQNNQEPTTRAEFLQYACDLTLDPTTAHEDLVVSEGDKEVKMRSTALRNSLPSVRRPERFIHRRQLLCREALQAECCYYEIEVEGDKVEIALAYKGIDRKSRTKLSAFGGNMKSWSLDRFSTYSVSHNNESVQLTTYPQHQRIAVYLKFKEGTVSFYEVSDNMIFLYKAEAKFTEPLYPGFWLGEKCCIRICDLSQDGL